MADVLLRMRRKSDTQMQGGGHVRRRQGLELCNYKPGAVKDCQQPSENENKVRNGFTFRVSRRN